MAVKMTERALVSLIASLEADCYGAQDSTLATERADAIDRYNGEPYGNEITGRSGAVSTDIRDTVETAVPQLLRIFLAGDEVVKFQPTGPEDEAGAQRETDYCNFVIHQRNNAFTLFSTWFRDALLQKNGYVKTGWEERSDIVVESYDGLTDDALAVLNSDPCVQITEQSTRPDPMVGMVHDVRVRRVHQTGFVKAWNVPCEEILVHNSQRDVCLSDCVFVEHRTNKTLSEIRQMGYGIPDDWAGEEYDATNNQEVIARDRFDEASMLDGDSADPSTRRATFKEIWARIDEDGDGIAELRRICMVNDHVVLDEEADLIPIAVCTPVIQPHRHIGYGYYDFLKEIELAHTALLRVFFDNNYLSVNGRYAVNVDAVNVDDLLVSRPGGIIRVKGDPGASIVPVVHSSSGDTALTAMQYLDAWKKQATGVVMDSQVLSSDTLNKSTASGISQAISVWQARVEAVARCFAETGVCELFRLIHALTLKHGTAAERVKMDQTWQTIDPREWVKRTDMTVSVGLGTGSKEMKVATLQQVLQMQGQAMQNGMPFVQANNIYETSKELLKEMGYKDHSRFLTDPQTVEPPPQQPPPQVQVAQIQAQTDMQIAQMKAGIDAQGKQTDAQRAGMEAQIKAAAQREVEMAQAQADIAVAKMQAQFKAQTDALKVQYDMELAAFKARQDQQTQIEIAKIKALAQVQTARVSANMTTASSMVEDLGGDTGVEVESDPVKLLAESVGQLAQAVARPKQIIRGPDGRAMGVQ